MKPIARTSALLVLTALAACDARPDPVGPVGPTVRTHALPLAIEAGTYFAVEPIDFPSPEAAGAQVITNSGQIAGVLAYETGGFGEYVLDRATGVLTEVPKPTSVGIIFFPRMNDIGTVAGSAHCGTDDCEYTAYRWSGGALELLDPGRRSPFARAGAEAVNDANVVVGHARGSTSGLQAALWEPDGSLRYLHDTRSAASDINDRGQVLVQVSQPGSFIHSDPYMWTETDGLQRLTDLEAAVAVAAGGPEFVTSVAVDEINDRGDIVGRWRDTNDDPMAFYYGADGTLQDFSALGPARGIRLNDLGEVGFKIISDPSGLEGTPYFWSSGAGLIALPVLGPSGGTAVSDINNAGELVGASAGVPVIWRPLTSADDALDELEEALDDVLDAGSVDVEGGNGLQAKLTQIRAHLEAGRANAARNQLEAFVNQVEAMMADGRLSAEDGATLLAAAAALAGLLA